MTDTDRELLAFVIGHRIRSLRQRRRLSQADLAHGIASQSLISLCESGRQLPLPDMLQMIAQRLQDDTLAAYAAALEANDLSFTSTITTNHQLLLEALASLRGHWQDVHERIAMELCQHYYTTKDFATVQQICRMIFDHTHDTPAYAKACFYYGSSCLYQHDEEQAEHWLVLAEEHLTEHDNPIYARLLYNLGYTYTERNNPVMALWYALRAAEAFQALQDLPSYAKALALLGVIQVRAKRPDDGQKSLLLAYDILQRWKGLSADKGRIACSLAATCLERGQVVEAKTWSERALAMGQSAKDPLCVCIALRNLALAHEYTGDIEQSEATLNRALATAEAHNLPKTTAELLLLRAERGTDGEQRLADAKRALDAALPTQDHVLIGIAAEMVADLLEASAGPTVQDIACEVNRHRKLALSHYRAYIRRVAYEYPGIHVPSAPEPPASSFDRSGQ
ncbi:MAG: tetratricopeptide repeat protein [Alicyclobacillus herbarius]|uniref:tetratricopeptide repeat protein n=1 Tax=Alicyclobacillus herbarius TaxID=122960 RepID=UPI002352167B|nr:tetratricopeptide repeat protein [Alicyclobacillus herbarius]MCL6632850.1 tetratricopeptide repeat protein [Alicyclobacillus herbarius]